MSKLLSVAYFFLVLRPHWRHGASHATCGKEVGTKKFCEERTIMPRILLQFEACSASIAAGATDLIWIYKNDNERNGE